MYVLRCETVGGSLGNDMKLKTKNRRLVQLLRVSKLDEYEKKQKPQE